MAAATDAQRKSGDAGARPEAKAAPRPIPRERVMGMSFVVGEMMNVTLFEDERVEEGLQDVKRWQLVGERLAMNQWLQVTNDAGSMFRVMRVERIHTSAGAGLRALVLRDVVPPKFIDIENEPIVATGDWYVRYLGAHRRWAVISPAGTVRRDGINTEGEAKTICVAEAGNRAPL